MARERAEDPVPGDMERSGEGVDPDDPARHAARGGGSAGKGGREDVGSPGEAREAPHSGTPVQNPEGNAREDPRLSAGEVAEDEVEPSRTVGNIQRGYRERDED